MSKPGQMSEDEMREFREVSQRLKKELDVRAPRPEAVSKPKTRARPPDPVETQQGTESKMLSAASQEFRDSLQTIQGFLELLLEDKVPDARQARHFLGIAYRETQYLSNRVKDLQTAASAAAGRLRLKPGPVPMEAVLRSLLSAASDLATAKGLRLGAMPAEELPTIQGDEALLRQALAGLLDVVIRRTEREGELAISASSDGTALKLRLAGINAGESHAAEPGRAPDGEKSEDIAAMGLAIYVADQILRKHDGALTAEGPQEKARAFTVNLPLKPKLSKRGLLLIVEDNPHAALLVEYAVEKEGFEAVRAMNGLEALEKAKAQRFDLVILDVLLPGIDGFEVCHRLRSAPETASLPIVMVSAKARDEDRATALRIGADAYLAKPLAMAQLMSTIETLLEEGHEK